jgi:hypothetical protein
MRKVGDSLELSATDLVGYLYCRHLSGLDRAVVEGTLPKPKGWDPLLQRRHRPLDRGPLDRAAEVNDEGER